MSYLLSIIIYSIFLSYLARKNQGNTEANLG
jgi:hypothetical protein